MNIKESHTCNGTNLKNSISINNSVVPEENPEGSCLDLTPFDVSYLYRVLGVDSCHYLL